MHEEIVYCKTQKAFDNYSAHYDKSIGKGYHRAFHARRNYLCHYYKTGNYKGIFGTSGGQCIFEFANGIPFSYTGTRAAHGNPFGFASRWSGQWIIHGKEGDIRREGGRLTLYKKGMPVEDYFLKDLDINLLEDEQIQFNAFYEALTSNKKKELIQETSLDTWILMEACNISAKKKEKISVKELKKNLYK